MRFIKPTTMGTILFLWDVILYTVENHGFDVPANSLKTHLHIASEDDISFIRNNVNNFDEDEDYQLEAYTAIRPPNGWGDDIEQRRTYEFP